MQTVAEANLAAVVDGILGYATENAVLVLGALLGLVVLTGGGFALYRYLTRSPVTRLRSVLQEYDEVTVLMHPDPDPDAMASALAVKQLAAAAGTAARLCYSGEIRRPENRAFETMLDLEFDHVDHVGDVGDTAVVLVDHNEPRGFAGAEEIDPVAVIDHHPGGGTGTRFTDVRPDTGACATILAEYFHVLEWDFHEVDLALTDGGVDTSNVPPDSLPSHVATGLIYGIQSDTRSLTNGCSGSDFSAAAYLYQGVDTDLLNRIANPQVDAEVLDVKARAITERVVDAPYAISDVGEVSNTDAVPQAADELETLEGVSAVVVMGEKEGTIRLAGRSRDDRVHIGRVIESVVSGIPMAEGGGHARMGGGKISVEHMDGLGPGKGVERDQLETMLFDAMAGER